METLRLLLDHEGLDVNHLPHPKHREDTLTALHRAAANGEPEAVRFLLSRGASPNVRMFKSRHTPLDLAIVSVCGYVPETATTLPRVRLDERRMEVVRLLLKAGTRREAMDQLGQSALTAAASAGATEAVDALLRLSYPPDFRGRAAAFAALRGFDDAVVRLVEDDERQRVLDFALGNTVSVGAIRGPNFRRISRQVVDAAILFLDMGADADAITADGEPVLVAATRGGRGDLVELLFSHGADPGAHIRGKSVLSLAVEQGNTTMAQLLIEVGASPSVPDDDGRTPLDRAQSRSDAAMLAVLGDSTKSAE